MKKLMIVSTVLVLLAPVALADHRDDRRNDYRNDRPIVELARQMKQATSQLNDRAEQMAYRGHRIHRFDEAALRALNRLDAQASRFKRDVRYFNGDRRELQRDFRQLERTFSRATDSMSNRMRVRLRRELDRTAVTLDKLERRVDGARYAKDRRDRERPRFSISVDTARGSRPRVRFNYGN